MKKSLKILGYIVLGAVALGTTAVAAGAVTSAIALLASIIPQKVGAWIIIDLIIIFGLYLCYNVGRAIWEEGKKIAGGQKPK